MYSQQVLDLIKEQELFLFDFLGVTHDGQTPPKTPTPAPKTLTLVRPENVDKIVTQALNQLKSKQNLLKKRNLTMKSVKQQDAISKPQKKRKTGDGETDDDRRPKKRKKIDKKDKKERRKADLKGRSKQKDGKNKAAKGGVTEGEEGTVVMDTAETEAETKSPKHEFVFGKIGITDGGTKKKQMGKDFKKHLKTLEDTKDKIVKAKSEDKVKGEALEKKVAWQNMISKAEGVKVKDDEGLIKKSIRRKDKMKDQRIKKWEKRETDVKDKMEFKANKRSANIRAKKDEKIKRKVKKMTKKGRLVAGLNAPDV